jgi:hypothetical protein
MPIAFDLIGMNVVGVHEANVRVMALVIAILIARPNRRRAIVKL